MKQWGLGSELDTATMFGEVEALCGRDVEAEALVVVRGRIYIKTSGACGAHDAREAGSS